MFSPRCQKRNSEERLLSLTVHVIRYSIFIFALLDHSFYLGFQLNHLHNHSVLS